MNGFSLVSDRRWPLHPQPFDWECLETWVRRIAKAYGVSYDAFLLNALGHSGGNARDLDRAPPCVFARLSAGSGIPVERLQAMTYARVMSRFVQEMEDLVKTPEGQAIRDILMAMGSSERRRRSAVRGF
jgi:hypothetical protein